MLKLTRRECAIANQIPTRNEHHGDKLHQAMDIVCTVLLTREELNNLMRRADADKMLFAQNGDIFEPYFGGVIAPIKLLGDFENSKVTFRVGIDLAKVEILKATIGKMTLDPQVGGMTSVKLMISALQTEEMKSLYDFMGTDQKIDIAVGKLVEIEQSPQKQLEMGEPKSAGEADAAAPPFTDAELSERKPPKRAPRTAGEKPKRDRSAEYAARKEARKSGKGK